MIPVILLLIALLFGVGAPTKPSNPPAASAMGGDGSDDDPPQ